MHSAVDKLCNTLDAHVLKMSISQLHHPHGFHRALRPIEGRGGGQIIGVLPQVPYKKKVKEDSEREREEERENWRGDSVLVRPCRI